MANNDPVQDRYSGKPMGVIEFDSVPFEDVEMDDLFWFTNHPNGDVNIAHRKISDTEGSNVRNNIVTEIQTSQTVFQKT